MRASYTAARATRAAIHDLRRRGHSNASIARLLGHSRAYVGRVLGPSPTLRAHRPRTAQRLRAQGRPVEAIAQDLGVSRTTVYRDLQSPAAHEAHRGPEARSADRVGPGPDKRPKRRTLK